MLLGKKMIRAWSRDRGRQIVIARVTDIDMFVVMDGPLG